MQVCSSAKCATSASQNRHPDLVIFFDPVPGLGHDGQHFSRERIALLGPIHGDDQGVVAKFDECMRLAHALTVGQNKNVF